MTGQRQKERIMKFADGLRKAQAFAEAGVLDQVVTLLEKDVSIFTEIEHDAIMAYYMAFGVFKHMLDNSQHS